MPAIWTSRQPWHRRPSGPVAPNWGSPQAVGLRAWFAATSQGPVDVLRRTALTATNRVRARAAGNGGIGEDCGTTTNWLSTTTPVTASPLTLVAWVLPDAARDWGAAISIANAATNADYFELALDATNRVAVGYRNTAVGGAYAYSSGSATLGTLTHTAGVFVGVASRTAYLNGTPGPTETTARLDPASVSRVGLNVLARNALADYGDQVIVDARIYARALSHAEIRALYDPRTRWELYQPIVQRSYFDMAGGGGGGDTTLAGALSGAGTVAGALTTAIRLAASVSASATTTAELTTAIRPAASVAGSASVSGALTTAIRCAAAVSGSGTVTAGLTTAIRCAASATGAGTVAGALTTQIRLASSVTGSATTTAAITTAITCAGAVTGTGTVTGSLDATAATFAASPAGSATVTGALTTAITCAGAITGTATVAGALESPAATFAAALTGSATTTGTLDTAIWCAAGVTGAATTTAALTTAVTLAAALGGVGTASGRWQVLMPRRLPTQAASRTRAATPASRTRARIPASEN